MALTASQIYDLDHMNSVAHKVKLGTLLDSSTGGALVDGHIFVGSGANVAADVAMSGDISIINTGATTIGAGKVTNAMLKAGTRPAYVVLYAGKHTTSADASDPYTNALAVTGVAATDIVVCSVQTCGASPVSLIGCIPTTDTLTFRFSADPSTDHIVSYSVLRIIS